MLPSCCHKMASLFISPLIKVNLKMLKYQVIEQSNIVSITIDGKITAENIKNIISVMKAVIEQYREIKIFVKVLEISGVEPAAVWEDLKFTFSHIGHIGRYAFVGNQKCLEPAVNIISPLSKPFTTANIKYFSREHTKEAWEWLREEIEMVEIIPMPTNNVVGLKLKGNISIKDFERIADLIREKEKSEDKIGIYVEVEKFTGVSIPTLIEELTFVFRRFNKFDKKAVVADKKWIEKVVNISNKIFSGIEVKYFSFQEKQQALDWISSKS